MTELEPPGRLKDGVHEIAFRVYYEDTDAGGVVYYANYLRFAERARTEWLRLLKIEQNILWREECIGFVVTHCSIDYKQPARLDDVMVLKSSLNKITPARITFLQTAYREEREIPLAQLKVEVACIDRTLKPARIPEFIRAKLDFFLQNGKG